MADQPDHYAELGVPPDAPADDIKRAYRKLALDAHPDRGGSERRMRRLNAAWATLGDPDSRRAYDTACHESRQASRQTVEVQKKSVQTPSRTAAHPPPHRESAFIKLLGKIAMTLAYGIGRVLRFVFGSK